MDTKWINQILQDTAYVHTGGTAEELERWLKEQTGVQKVSRVVDSRIFKKLLIGILAVGLALGLILEGGVLTPRPRAMTASGACSSADTRVSTLSSSRSSAAASPGAKNPAAFRRFAPRATCSPTILTAPASVRPPASARSTT